MLMRRHDEVRQPARKAWIAVLGVCLCATTTMANPDSPSITVSGHGEHGGSPDQAVIGFAVETTAPDAATAMGQNADKSQAVTGALKSAIGKADRISTTGYSLDPVYDHRRNRPPDEPPTITGYVARNEVRVETSDTGGVGKLIDLAAKAGANRISGLQFTLKNQEEARAKALQLATADAARQAKTIAESLGVRLGGVLYATTSQPATIAPRAMRGAAMAMESYAPTPIEPGQVRVEATVHVTYAIE
jgi:uncharacterized protein YggE